MIIRVESLDASKSTCNRPINKCGVVFDTLSSDIFHDFLNTLTEGNIRIANHPKTLKELLALNVDEKTGKVIKPAGGQQGLYRCRSQSYRTDEENSSPYALP